MCYQFILHVAGSTNVPAPNRLTVFERQVYWTDSTRQGVIRIDKFNGTDSLKIVYNNTEGVKNPRAIRAVHLLMQPKGKFLL